MTVTTETQWCVRFVGDYFTLTTQVYASGEDEAIAIGTAQLKDQHGLDMESTSVRLTYAEAFDVTDGWSQ